MQPHRLPRLSSPHSRPLEMFLMRYSLLARRPALVAAMLCACWAIDPSPAAAQELAIGKSDLNAAACRAFQDGASKPVDEGLLWQILGLVPGNPGRWSAGDKPNDGQPGKFEYLLVLKKPVAVGSISRHGRQSFPAEGRSGRARRSAPVQRLAAAGGAGKSGGRVHRRCGSGHERQRDDAGDLARRRADRGQLADRGPAAIQSAPGKTSSPPLAYASHEYYARPPISRRRFCTPPPTSRGPAKPGTAPAKAKTAASARRRFPMSLRNGSCSSGTSHRCAGLGAWQLAAVVARTIRRARLDQSARRHGPRMAESQRFQRANGRAAGSCWTSRSPARPASEHYQGRRAAADRLDRRPARTGRLEGPAGPRSGPRRLAGDRPPFEISIELATADNLTLVVNDASGRQRAQPGGSRAGDQRQAVAALGPERRTSGLRRTGRVYLASDHLPTLSRATSSPFIPT